MPTPETAARRAWNAMGNRYEWLLAEYPKSNTKVLFTHPWELVIKASEAKINPVRECTTADEEYALKRYFRAAFTLGEVHLSLYSEVNQSKPQVKIICQPYHISRYRTWNKLKPPFCQLTNILVEWNTNTNAKSLSNVSVSWVLPWLDFALHREPCQQLSDLQTKTMLEDFLRRLPEHHLGQHSPVDPRAYQAMRQQESKRWQPMCSSTQPWGWCKSQLGSERISQRPSDKSWSSTYSKSFLKRTRILYSSQNTSIIASYFSLRWKATSVRYSVRTHIIRMPVKRLVQILW